VIVIKNFSVFATVIGPVLPFNFGIRIPVKDKNEENQNTRSAQDFVVPQGQQYPMYAPTMGWYFSPPTVYPGVTLPGYPKVQYPEIWPQHLMDRNSKVYFGCKKLLV